MRKKDIGSWIVILITVSFIIIMAQTHTIPAKPLPIGKQPASRLIAKAVFLCDGEKSVITAFYSGETIPSASPDLPPVPGGSADLILSDGRSMNLPHVVSADGGRYANADESFVFWNRGDTAFITENNAQTFANCAAYQGNNATSTQ